MSPCLCVYPLKQGCVSGLTLSTSPILIVALPPILYMGNNPLPRSTYLQLQADNDQGKSPNSVTRTGSPKAHFSPEFPSGHLSLSLTNTPGWCLESDVLADGTVFREIHGCFLAIREACFHWSSLCLWGICPYDWQAAREGLALPSPIFLSHSFILSFWLQISILREYPKTSSFWIQCIKQLSTGQGTKEMKSGK